MITFFVHGDPKGQPRPRAFARKFGDKWQARVYDAGTAESWKSQIAAAAEKCKPAEAITGPVRVTCVFYFRRPKAHFRTGKYSERLRDDAPSRHAQKPDRDNLDKAVLDALTQIGFWVDDSQACDGEICKLWVMPGESSGCRIDIETLGNDLLQRYWK